MIEYLEGRYYRRAVLDADMDSDSIRTGCRIGEQFCDVCRGQGRKRIRMQVRQGEDQALPIGHGGGKLTLPRKRKGGRRARYISSSP